MRIGLDCRLGGHAHAGIGRYISNLAIRLPTLAPQHHWVFFCTSSKQAEEILDQRLKLVKNDDLPHNACYVPVKNNDSQSVLVVITPFHHYSWAEQWQFPKIISKLTLDLLHVPHFNIPILYQGPLVVTIHDLLWHEYRGLTVTTLNPFSYWFKYLAYRFTVSQAVHKATTIFVPAETIQKTVVKYYPEVASKIKITPEGIDQSLLQKPKIVSHLTKTLIYVGSLYPHKNLQLVLQALVELPDYSLKIIGARSVFMEKMKKKVREYSLEKKVFFLGYKSDQEISELLSTASALIQPSLSEGFGLTGIEAMALGCPVLASDIPIFKEVYGSAAIYFNPHSVPDFVKAVAKLEHSSRAQLQERGFRQIKKYNWNTLVHQTLSAYETTLHSIKV